MTQKTLQHGVRRFIVRGAVPAITVLTVIATTESAHAATPLRQIFNRPWDFVSAVYSVFSGWGVGEAFRGAGASPWALAVQVLTYCLWWNPWVTAVLLVLMAIGLAWMFYAYINPRIEAALRARGFST